MDCVHICTTVTTLHLAQTNVAGLELSFLLALLSTEEAMVALLVDFLLYQSNISELKESTSESLDCCLTWLLLFPALLLMPAKLLVELLNFSLLGGGGGGALAGDPCCPLWGSSGGIPEPALLDELPPEAVLLRGEESESPLVWSPLTPPPPPPQTPCKLL